MPLLSLLILLGAGVVHPTDTCVEVIAAEADPLRQLLIDELGRHRSHQFVEERCLSHLRVELISFSEQRYLTGRINAQVPHRDEIAGSHYPKAVDKLLRVLHHNHPVRLRGPRGGWLRKKMQALKKGRNLYALEFFQLLSDLEGQFQSLPGLAFGIRRELDSWHLGGRFAYAGRWEKSEHLQLRGHLSAQLHLVRFLSSLSRSSLYLGGSLGLEHQRFRGPIHLEGESGREDFSKTGLGAGLRLGWEGFRLSTTRVDLFCQAQLPLFKAKDEEAWVIDAWAPSLGLGMGLLF